MGSSEQTKTTGRRHGWARSQSKPAARAGLAIERLVEAALDLLQEVGLDSLSTRRLAARLDVKSPALYWHVHNKNELLALLSDAICAEMALPPRRLPMRDRLRAIAEEYRRVLIAHRDAFRLFAEHPPTGPHRMALYEAAIDAFLDGGFPLPEAVAMATFFRHYLLGMIGEEARQRRPGEAGKTRPTRALGIEVEHLGEQADQYPHLRQAAGLLADIEPVTLFRLGLEVILDGVERHVKHGVKTQRRPRSIQAKRALR